MKSGKEIVSELRLDLGNDFRFGESAHEFVNLLSVLEEKHRGNRADAVVHSEIFALVHVDLHDVDLSGELFAHFVERGREFLAGTAPSGVKVNDEECKSAENSEELMRRAIKLMILFEFVIAESVRLAYELDGKICLVAW